MPESAASAFRVRNQLPFEPVCPPPVSATALIVGYPEGGVMNHSLQTLGRAEFPYRLNKAVWRPCFKKRRSHASDVPVEKCSRVGSVANLHFLRLANDPECVATRQAPRNSKTLSPHDAFKVIFATLSFIGTGVIEAGCKTLIGSPC